MRPSTSARNRHSIRARSPRYHLTQPTSPSGTADPRHCARRIPAEATRRSTLRAFRAEPFFPCQFFECPTMPCGQNIPRNASHVYDAFRRQQRFKTRSDARSHFFGAHSSSSKKDSQGKRSIRRNSGRMTSSSKSYAGMKPSLIFSFHCHSSSA